MYNRKIIDELVDFIYAADGINDKAALSAAIIKRFALETDRKVYFNNDFAIRFSRSASRNMGNTVLSLSALQKYDNKPFLVCIVTPKENFLLLANTTFLSKISHSSQALRVDNIKGSFNGSDIMRQLSGLDNDPENFEALSAIHQGFTFEDNLERLVAATNGIVGTGKRAEFGPEEIKTILAAPGRAFVFLASDCYADLLRDLTERVRNVQREIAIASRIDNVNIRGRIIEYLISSNGGPLKDRLIDSLRNGRPIPEFKTDDALGDYIKTYPDFITETDIKTKALFLNSCPKAYNIDKLLDFLAREKSVYLIFIVGIDEKGNTVTGLYSVFHPLLLSTTNVIRHWAGRNSRGVAQFNGQILNRILSVSSNELNVEHSVRFLEGLLACE